MPSIIYSPSTQWENYHKTERLWIARPAAYAQEDVGDLSGPDRFATTSEALYSYLGEVLRGNNGCGLLGIGWSFSPLVGMPDLQLDLRQLSGCSPAAQTELHQNCKLDATELAYVSGGTSLRAIANWARPSGKSLFTSGTHLAPTIAGGAATASHGSRLGYGGLQNQIVGMHFITDENESVWIERQNEPVLSDASAKIFASRIIRDDKKFDDALIHLGGMGIVNGVVMRLAPYKKYHVLANDQPLWPEWLGHMQSGDFRAIAERLGHNNEPVFYEATIDPSNFMGPHALHICYFEAPDEIPEQTAPDTALPAPLTRPADAVARYAKALPEKHAASAEFSSPLPPDFNLLAVYASEYFDYHKPPLDVKASGHAWEEIHGDDITGGVAGALYNASYAIRREDVSRAVPIICAAVKHLPATFIFTLRFVSGAAGTLAFTRFPECAVIEIDGLSENAPLFGKELGQITHSASLIVRNALEASNIDYSMHWAKLGELDAVKVERDYGPSSDPHSPISRWRATRNEFLTTRNRTAFRNRALRRYGIV